MQNILLFFGGKSAEHEVSIRSAKNIYTSLNKEKYKVTLIGITKTGSWILFKDSTVFDLISLVDEDLQAHEKVCLVCDNGKPYLLNRKTYQVTAVDLAFPVMHGTMGEDGTIQGLFEMANLPYVGCGVLGSAIGMDKEFMKKVLLYEKLPTAKYLTLRKSRTQSFAEIKNQLGLPFFIKPANAGSSVGVHKIKDETSFKTQLADAFKYDHKVLAEEFIKGREVECSVMGLNQTAKSSLPGEIIPQHEFYSYEAKYIDDNGASFKIPADLPKEIENKIREVAIKAYEVLGCDGLTRVDFFVSGNDILINEVNTLPGFTKISMYPKMWEVSGVSQAQLTQSLVDFGFARAAMRAELKMDFG